MVTFEFYKKYKTDTVNYAIDAPAAAATAPLHKTEL